MARAGLSLMTLVYDFHVPSTSSARRAEKFVRNLSAKSGANRSPGTSFVTLLMGNRCESRNSRT